MRGSEARGAARRARQGNLVTAYGSARWATLPDLKQSGLLNPAGILLGRSGEHHLRHDGAEHVMAFAPTRSGKGVGLVIPTLLSWTGSAVIHDIKGENFSITAGWRSCFSHCLYVNPTQTRSAAHDPLLEVRRGAHEVRDVQNIADVLVDPEGPTRLPAEGDFTDPLSGRCRLKSGFPAGSVPARDHRSCRRRRTAPS